ncbi:MAG: hypothetical protein EPO09_21490 [Aquabacterium sp.]|uniref:hypothetical protein n=1 Tax=Aquabacterium sp. TaxID=1872578 RepID=UPI0012008914|nr:hypothetical protein [Aquabacterium sp.]TAK82815.1 MAG: hypothetical protein EPO09_21490 [Aquabacterium sp.]
MRRIAISLSLAAVLAISFTAGYFYRAYRTPASFAMEDYALTNILEDLGYMHYLAKGEHEAMRTLLDVTLNEHLSLVRLNHTGRVDAEFEAARTRTLNALAIIWDQYPPFQSAEWKENSSNAFWWSEWYNGHQQNLALLKEAKAKCGATPALNCTAKLPTARFPAAGDKTSAQIAQ